MNNPLKAVAVLLIVAGVLGLVRGGFSYVQTTHQADLGPLHVQVNDKRHVNVPVWLSLVAVAGGVLLLVTRKP